MTSSDFLSESARELENDRVKLEQELWRLQEGVTLAKAENDRLEDQIRKMEAENLYQEPREDEALEQRFPSDKVEEIRELEQQIEKLLSDLAAFTLLNDFLKQQIDDDRICKKRLQVERNALSQTLKDLQRKLGTANPVGRCRATNSKNETEECADKQTQTATIADSCSSDSITVLKSSAEFKQYSQQEIVAQKAELEHLRKEESLLKELIQDTEILLHLQKTGADAPIKVTQMTIAQRRKPNYYCKK